MLATKPYPDLYSYKNYRQRIVSRREIFANLAKIARTRIKVGLHLLQYRYTMLTANHIMHVLQLMAVAV